MALPNGDLITTVFDPQMAYPVDKRMQVDTLNSRDSMSMFIRWEGMEVYVLETSKKYILQGGRSNEFWKENGTGTGTGGTTFVGQFATADLLPTSGRSAGDYAFVGTGDDFVQYNWDNIANQWVMAEGQTDMASEFFHIGYKTPLRRPVIFPLFPKDVLVQESGDFVFATETAVARFIFVGEVTAIRGIETAVADREIKLVNRTGSDIPLRDKASGIPSDSGFDFGGTDYTWVNGSEITLKGNGTYWELAPNNQIAFSDHLDSVNAQVSVGSDGLEVITGILDRNTGEEISFKQLGDNTYPVDGVLSVLRGGDVLRREFTGPINIKWFGATGNEDVDDTDAIQACFTSLKAIRDHIRSKTGRDGLVTVYFPAGTYNFNSTINIHDTGGVSVMGDGITNTILNYGGAETAISIGDGVTRARYFGLRNFGLRNYSGNAKRAIVLNYAHEGMIENVWVSGGNMGFTESGLSLKGSPFGCWTIKFNNIRITNTTGIAFLLHGERHRSCTFNDCSASTNLVSLWVQMTSGIKFNDWQAEAASSGHLVRIGPYDGTSDHRSLAFNNPYFEIETGNENGRLFYISDKDKDGISRTTWINGLNIYAPSGNGGNVAEYAVEFDNASTDSLLTGNITAARFVDFTQSLIKSNSRFHKFKFEPFKTTLGEPVPYVSDYESGITVMTNYHTLDINKPLRLSVEDQLPPLYAVMEGGVWYHSPSKRLRYGTGGNDTRYIPFIYFSPSTPNESDFPRLTGASYLRTNSRVVEMWDGNEFFDMRDRRIRNVALTGIAYSFSSTDHEYYLRISGTGGNINVVADRFKPGSQIYGHVESGNILIAGSGGMTVLSGKGVYNRIPAGCRFHIFIIDSTTCFLSVSHFSQSIEREISDTNYSLATLDLGRYLRFTGDAGNNTILDGRFSEEDEIQGEIEGGTKTFVAGAGVTLRFPDGQGLVAPTGSRFIIKFKSPNDALVTIIKPYATTFPELTDTPANYTGHKNKSVKVNNEETALVFVADGVDVRNITDGGSIAPTLTDGFIGSRLNFTSSTAVTLQGFTSSGGQSSVTLVNPHATNNLTLVHNGAGTVKYIDAGATDLVIAPKTAVKVEIVGNEIYRVL